LIIVLRQIENPSISGGTGNFQLLSLHGNNKFNENLIFGSIGVAETIEEFSSVLINVEGGSSSDAGEPTKYNFAFKTNTHLPQSMYMEIWIPKTAGFTVSNNPSCSLYEINGVLIKGNIKCSYKKFIVTIK